MQEILGEKVHRRLQDIPSPETIDVLDVFRRAEDLNPHLPDILELKPKVDRSSSEAISLVIGHP